MLHHVQLEQNCLYNPLLEFDCITMPLVLPCVMYTTSCWSGSSVSSVDVSASLSQLISSIEIFSRLLVSSVGPTCSSLTEVDNLQGVPPTGGEGETMVTP